MRPAFFLVRLPFVAVAILFLSTCHEKDVASADRVRSAKLNPVGIAGPAGVDVSGAWAMFDRDTESGWTVPAATGEDLALSVPLPSGATVSALKVFGPSPFHLGIESADGVRTDFDLSTLGAGWNTVAVTGARAPLTLHVVSTAGTGSISEIELWGDQRVDDRRVDDLLLGAADALPAKVDSIPAAPAELRLDPPVGGDRTASCGEFLVDLRRAPELYRRAWLVFESAGLFRPFGLTHFVNGRLIKLGEWIAPASADSSSTWAEPVDPAWLFRGPNLVELCVPTSATGSVVLRSVRLVAETEDGANLVSRVTIGGLEAPAVADGDAESGETAGPEAPLVFVLDRWAAPDRIELATSPAATWRVSCRTLEGDWSPVSTRLDAGSATRAPSLAILGAPVCAALQLVPDGEVAVTEATVVGSGARQRVDWPRLVVASAREHFGSMAWLDGWVDMPAGEPGGVDLTIDGAVYGSLPTRVFASRIERLDDFDSPWVVDLTAELLERSVSEEVVLYQNGQLELEAALDAGSGTPGDATADSRYGKEDQTVTADATPDSPSQIRLGTDVGIDLPAGAVGQRTRLSVTHVAHRDLPPLNPGLLNVTAPRGHAYEFTPHGQKFLQKVQVLVPIETAALPPGFGAEDVVTYYYDPVAERWEPLERASVDQDRGVVHSLTDHFTLMINTVLVAPEHPTVSDLKPTTISELQAASPFAKVNLIAPPQASPQGGAKLRYPIEVPPGRAGLQPDLAIEYDSARSNGWLGVGWDLPMSSIGIDTRWGAPRFATDHETETYLLDGAQLTPVAHRTKLDDLPARSTGDKVFHQRVEGSFRHIVRHGTKPSEYWWEITDKNGTRYAYGRLLDRAPLDGVLAGPLGVFRWALREVRDLRGNWMRFDYAVATETLSGTNPGVQLYPSRIEYTGHGSDGGAYEVVLRRASELGETRRTDVGVDLTGGFKQVTADLLRQIEVRYGQPVSAAPENRQWTVVRRYDLAYSPHQTGTVTPFGKTLLASIKQYGVGGVPFEGNEHDFEYYDDVRVDGAYQGFSPAEDWDTGDDAISREELANFGRSGSSALGMSATRNNGNHPYGGFSYKASKTGSIGNTLANNLELSEELVVFTDVDGDGLPDKVFHPGSVKDSLTDLAGILLPGGGGNVYPGDLYYRRNLGAGEKRFGEKRLLWEGGALPRDGTRSYSASLEWYPDVPPFEFSVSASVSYSLGLSDIYMADVNGDGLVDIVANGNVLFNRRVGDDPRFLLGSANTPVPIEAGDPRMGGVFLEEKLADIADFALDPLDKLLDIIFDAIPHFIEKLYDVLPGWLSGPLKWLTTSVFDVIDKLIDWLKSKVGSDQFRKIVMNIAEPSGTGPDASGVIDVLRRWTAPYAGTVTISGDVALAAAQTHPGADGVRVAIQHEDTELWSDVIGPTDTSAHTPAGVSQIVVAAGEDIYFRVGSINDGTGDEVVWDPVVTYDDPLFAGAKDQNGLSGVQFTASQDFNYSGRPAEITMPFDGTIAIEGNVSTLGPTSDDVTAKAVLVRDSGGLSEQVFPIGTLPSAKDPASLPVSLSFEVNKDDRLKLLLAVDSPIDITQVEWQPRVYYTGATGLPNAFHPDGSPVVAYDAEWDIDTYPVTDLLGPERPWRVPTQAEISCPSHPVGPCADGVDNDGDGFGDCSDPDCAALQPAIASVSIHATAWMQYYTDDIVFTVKRAGQLVHKATMAQGDNGWPAVDVVVPVSEGDELYFGFSTRNSVVESMGHAVTVTYLVRDEVSTCTSDDQCASGHCTLDDSGVTGACDLVPVTESAPSTFFGEGVPTLWPRAYRGWALLGYDGGGARAAAAIDQGLLSVANANPAMGGVLYPLSPVPKTHRWEAVNDKVFVTATHVASGRSLDAAYSPDLEGDGLSDMIARRSRTLQTTKSASAGLNLEVLPLGIGANTSTADGDSWSKLDYLDLNGDRFPDVAGDGGVQYTWATGGLVGKVYSFGDRVRRTHHQNSANGIGLNASVANPLASHGNAKAQVQSPATAPANGAKAGTQKGSISLSANGSIGDAWSRTAFDWVDMNGDGLPDRVHRICLPEDQKDCSGGALIVELSTGYSLLPPEVWGVHDLGSGHSSNMMGGVSIGYGKDDFSLGESTSVSQRTGFTDAAFVDVNGDGLADAVWGGGPELVVALNTGSGFADPVLWKGAILDDGKAVVAKNESTDATLGVYFTKTIGPLCYVSCFIVINAGKDAGSGVARQIVMMRDIDGDGLLDHLKSTSDARISAALNRTGRTNLLRRVKRPYGSEIQLTYEHSQHTYELPQSRWLLTGVVVSDGRPGNDQPPADSGADAAAHVQASRFAYDGGYYDRNERELYGFQTVAETQLDTRGMTFADALAAVAAPTPDKDYRRIRRTYLNGDPKQGLGSYYQKGLIALEETEAPTEPAQPYARTYYTYQYRDVETGSHTANIGSTTATIFPALQSVARIRYEGSLDAYVGTSQAMDYDEYGNVTSFVDAGDPGDGDNLVATITYTGNADGENAGCAARHIVGKADSVDVVDGNGNPLRSRKGGFDCATGELTQLTEYGGASPNAVSSFTYDDFGALSTLKGPANLHGQRHELQFTYDSETHSRATRIDDLSFQYYSEATYDPKLGEMTSTTDINGNTYTRTFDDFGRLATVTAPYEIDASAPFTVRHTYVPNAGTPYALTEHHDSLGAPDIRTVVFTDGLGRTIQTKRDATLHSGPNSAPLEAMVVSGRVVFDHLGRTTATWYPTTDTRSNAMQPSWTYDGQMPTRTQYDLLDRLTLMTFPDGTTLSAAHSIAKVADDTYRLVETMTDPESKVKRTFRNARDLVTAVEERIDGVPITTTYGYDPMNDLTDVRDAKGNHTQIAYDLLGRRLSVENLDTGKVEQVYDGAGNLIQRITPNLGTDHPIEIDYAFDRLVSIQYPEHSANDVTYRYGDESQRGLPGNRVGRILSITDGSGSVERSYGKLGEVTTEARTISPAAAVHADTFVTKYAHDSFGRLRTLGYPDGEQVVYTYDGGGQPSKVVGARVYVERLEYDRFGQRAFMRLGNGVTTTYAYDPQMHRLERLTSAPEGAVAFQDLQYAYYPAGNVRSLINNVPAPQVGFGGHVAQSFTYDDLYRLKTASGQFTGRLGNERYDLTMAYDVIHNIQHKTQTHTVQRGGSPDQTQRSTTYDWAYTYGGPRPHAPTAVGDRTFSWDANGNLTGWETSPSAQHRSIEWDEENRVRSISDNGRTTRFVYDASGNRVVKAGPRGESVYVNTYYTAQGGGPATKHVFVGTVRVASVVEPGSRDMLFLTDQFPGQGIYHWSSVAAEHAQNLYKNKHLMAQELGVPEDFVYFYHPDHLGSTAYVTDETGRIYEHLEYFPFGETWVEEASNAQRVRYLFSSKELDQETGLYYFGARYYDPRVGTWVSPDGLYLQSPDRALQSSFEVGVYTYGRDNPIAFTDPDGHAVYLSNRSPLEDWKRVGLGFLSLAGGTFKFVTGLFGASWQEQVMDEQAEQIQGTIDGVADLYFNWDEMTFAEKREVIEPLATALLVAAVTHKAGAKDPEHHLMTNKNKVATNTGGPWTPRFEALAKRAGMTLEDAENKVVVPGHRGPHPQAYHEAVYERLRTATRGLRGEAYTKAFKAELESIRTDAATPGSALNRLLTEQ